MLTEKVEWMLRTLMNLGFTETEAHVYCYLARKGPQKAGDIARALNLYKQSLYRSLKKMQNKNIIKVSKEDPALFSTIPFETVLDLFINANIEEAKHVMQNKQELLSSWRSMIERETAKS